MFLVSYEFSGQRCPVYDVLLDILNLVNLIILLKI